MAEDKLKYIQFQENESTSNQPKKIPFEIDAKNVIVSIRDNDNEENPREVDLQTFYSELENNYTIFKNTISTNVDDQTKIRFEVLPLSPALSEFGEEDLNALKNIKDINVVDISTEVSSDEPKDKYTVTLDSVKNEIKKIQSLLLAPPVVQIENFGDMINTQKIYVYINKEDNSNYGHWFYYSKEENSWKDGGIYSTITNVNKIDNEIDGIRDDIVTIKRDINILTNNDINVIKFGAYDEDSNEYQFYDGEGHIVFALTAGVSGDVTDTATNLVNIAKSWAVGPSELAQQGTANNNAKYYADQAKNALNSDKEQIIADLNSDKEQIIADLENASNNYVNQSKLWAIGDSASSDDTASSINNSKYYSNLSKSWAIGPQIINNNSENSINPVPTEQNNAKYYAEQARNALDGFNQDIKTKCVTSFNGNSGDIIPRYGDYDTRQIKRIINIDTNQGTSLENQLQRIDTTINTIDDKVDKTLSQLNLNINAEQGTEDYSLRLSIEALGWREAVITNE